MSSALTASLEILPALPELETRWRALELRSRASFFTSWTWIGTWLRRLPVDVAPRLLVAEQDGICVGLAVIVRGTVRSRAGMPVCDTWYLHATGRSELDTLTIEHNDFLLDRRCEHESRRAMLDAWRLVAKGSVELYLPGVPADRFGREVVRSGWTNWRWHAEDRTSYAVDLNAVRRAQGDAFMLLGAKSRNKARRNLREYHALGEVRLEVAQGLPEALQWFSRMVDLHQAHWTAKGHSGAFARPWVRDFHCDLIAAGLPRAEVQVQRVSAGGAVVAYLYTYVHGDRAYFYQGGLDYGLVDPKFAQPGILAHLLAVQHLSAQGLAVYDFMVGDSRYKGQLSNLRETLSWVTLQSPSLRLRAEGWLRRWRRGVQVAAAEESSSDSD